VLLYDGSTMCTAPYDDAAFLPYLIRGEQVHFVDEQGRLVEVTGPLRGILLGEIEAARILSHLAHLPGAVRGGRE
jgi:hypothetical protein